MSDLLHNMSAPPRSKVYFQQEQLMKYVAFHPLVLAELLGDKDADLGQKAKDYYQKYLKDSNVAKPTGYMIAEAIDFTGGQKDKLDKYQYVECRDPKLLILVFCSTVGDLYIPARPLSFESSRFEKILLFPEEEVYS